MFLAWYHFHQEQTTKTDGNGSFQFTNLPADQNILFALDENDTKLKTIIKVFLADMKGTIVKEFNRVNGKFKFSLLPADYTKMGVLYVDDPWLKVLQLKNEVKQEAYFFLLKILNSVLRFFACSSSVHSTPSAHLLINLLSPNPFPEIRSFVIPPFKI